MQRSLMEIDRKEKKNVVVKKGSRESQLCLRANLKRPHLAANSGTLLISPLDGH